MAKSPLLQGHGIMHDKWSGENRSGRNFQTCTLDGHLHSVKYTRCCIDTIYSPDDEHEVARNMLRIEIKK
jgi:hypothetical protein